MKKIKDIIHLFKGDLLEFIGGAEESEIKEGENFIYYDGKDYSIQFNYKVENGIESISNVEGTRVENTFTRIQFDESDGEEIYSELEYM